MSVRWGHGSGLQYMMYETVEPPDMGALDNTSSVAISGCLTITCMCVCVYVCMPVCVGGVSACMCVCMRACV